jgi:hypothetical protein
MELQQPHAHGCDFDRRVRKEMLAGALTIRVRLTHLLQYELHFVQSTTVSAVKCADQLGTAKLELLPVRSLELCARTKHLESIVPHRQSGNSVKTDW